MDNQAFEECMSRISRGDTTALKDIYDAYARYIYYLVLPLTGSREDAQDITSDVFIRIWKAAGSFKGKEGHRGWIAAIARNHAIDYLRKRSREVAGGLEEIGELSDAQLREGEPDEYSRLVSDLTVSQVLDRLSPSEREIVHLKIIGEMTFQEIASVLQIPMGTVTWRYRRAMEKLRRCGYDEA